MSIISAIRTESARPRRGSNTTHTTNRSYLPVLSKGYRLVFALSLLGAYQPVQGIRTWDYRVDSLHYHHADTEGIISKTGSRSGHKPTILFHKQKLEIKFDTKVGGVNSMKIPYKFMDWAKFEDNKKQSQCKNDNFTFSVTFTVKNPVRKCWGNNDGNALSTDYSAKLYSGKEKRKGQYMETALPELMAAVTRGEKARKAEAVRKAEEVRKAEQARKAEEARKSQKPAIQVTSAVRSRRLDTADLTDLEDAINGALRRYKQRAGHNYRRLAAGESPTGDAGYSLALLLFWIFIATAVGSIATFTMLRCLSKPIHERQPSYLYHYSQHRHDPLQNYELLL